MRFPLTIAGRGVEAGEQQVEAERSRASAAQGALDVRQAESCWGRPGAEGAAWEGPLPLIVNSARQLLAWLPSSILLNAHDALKG